jgi:hypothetical protein
MARCVHCWHNFEDNDAGEQARARGQAWVHRMSRFANEMNAESDDAELSLVFCCKCGEPRLDHRRLLLLAAHRR